MRIEFQRLVKSLQCFLFLADTRLTDTYVAAGLHVFRGHLDRCAEFGDGGVPASGFHVLHAPLENPIRALFT
jgi:hypothetical protein